MSAAIARTTIPQDWLRHEEAQASDHGTIYDAARLCGQLRVHQIGMDAGLDCATISENDRVVVDDRVPGDDKAPKTRLYRCGICGRTKLAPKPPPCPVHRKLMSLVKPPNA